MPRANEICSTFLSGPWWGRNAWWRHQMETFPLYWTFVRGIHRLPANSPHKCQSRGALMLSLICAWINGWVNNREAGDLRRHRRHCNDAVLIPACAPIISALLAPCAEHLMVKQFDRTDRFFSLTHWSLGTTYFEFLIKYNNFHSRKWIWNYRLCKMTAILPLPQWIDIRDNGFPHHIHR